MLNRLYRQTRRFLSPVHPNRLYSRARVLAQRLRDRLYPLFRIWHPRRLTRTAGWAIGLLAAQRRRRREERLTVAVDISPLWEPLTGIGWYLYRLLEHLADRDDLRLRLYGPNLIDTPDLPAAVIALPSGPAIEVVSYALPEPEVLIFRYTPLVERLRARQDRLIAADGNRVLFAPNYLLPESFSRCRGKLVLTVHDLSFERVPWTMQEQTREHLSTHLRRNAEQAVRIITDSETVRQELIDSRIVGPHRLRAIPLGPGPTASASGGELPAGTPARFALHVGTLEPRKNLPLLFEVWQRLRRLRPDAPTLVLCGRFGWKSEELRSRVTAGEEEGWLRHFGYLADPQVAALYQHAEMVVLPSIYEGFGLPAVEAMCFGVPLLCSDIPVLREVAGEAALFAPPDDPDAWLAALLTLLEDPLQWAKLARLGSARGSLFSWQKTAAATLEVWREALDREGQDPSPPAPSGPEAATP